MTKESFTNEEGLALPLAVIATIRDNRDHLSDLDGAAGDGDHGINMAKGMTIAQSRIEETNASTLTEGFAIISDVLLSEIGGSMGPLYGGFFRGISVKSRGQDTIDASLFAEMFGEGIKRIRRVTEAQVGDKTLIDVLEPAYDAYTGIDGTFVDALTAMHTAAETGLESTRNMQARIGRSSRLGERSIGHLDAGAASCTLILAAVRNAATELLAKGTT